MKRVWLFVEIGWERRATLVDQWSTTQKDVASFNNKAMNAIFNIISMEIVHEGTKVVKINKLQ